MRKLIQSWIYFCWPRVHSDIFCICSVNWSHVGTRIPHIWFNWIDTYLTCGGRYNGIDVGTYPWLNCSVGFGSLVIRAVFPWPRKTKRENNSEKIWNIVSFSKFLRMFTKLYNDRKTGFNLEKSKYQRTTAWIVHPRAYLPTTLS